MIQPVHVIVREIFPRDMNGSYRISDAHTHAYSERALMRFACETRWLLTFIDGTVLIVLLEIETLGSTFS